MNHDAIVLYLGYFATGLTLSYTIWKACQLFDRYYPKK